MGPGGDAAPVDFVVIGAMKAMTTSLLGTLGSHPGIATSRHKETSFFVAETGWWRGRDWYLSEFAHAEPGQLRGEASPQYTFFPVFAGVPERMAACAPDVRLVYLVREPVARAVSQWRHASARGEEQRPMAEALLVDARYQGPSRYWLQLVQYFRCFSEEQLLVVDADRLRREPADVLREVVAHIGADPAQAPTELLHLNGAEGRRQARPLVARALRNPTGQRVVRHVRRNHQRVWDRWMTSPAPAPEELAPDMAQRLRDVFADDSAALGRHLGSTAPEWAR
ncbi:MAG TPA: sulfotransferase domain-containing protein [Mycobacteriales bacterium]|nr:sulfotransferase domain-containing protein [Mycobacteriales bacterium]